MGGESDSTIPMLKDDNLLFGSAFGFRGEGSQYCKKPKKGGNRLVIQVSACDRGLVAFVASAWGTRVELTRHTQPGCNPEVSGLSDNRFNWRTRAYGGIALAVIKAYKSRGILVRERELKLWTLESRLGFKVL
jgi:hypothetical protein